jgi:hypothetical protein
MGDRRTGKPSTRVRLPRCWRLRRSPESTRTRL